MMPTAFFLTLGASFLLSLLLTPLAARLGERLGLVQAPDARRRHKGIVARTGGLGMALAFLIVVVLTAILPLYELGENMAQEWFPPTQDPNEGRRLAGVLIGGLFVTLAGLRDDWRELSGRAQLLIQFVASLIAISTLIFIERVNNPFTDQIVVFPWPVVGALTIFWVMGMMNTVNWLDGLDGLAASVAAVLCVVLAVHMWRTGQHSVALLPLALLGATLGFLPFNWHPARAFMGSSGAYFLGYALAALGIVAGARVATVLLVMGLPILDVAWLIVRRWRRHGTPAAAGRDHLHFRLLDMGFSTRQIVLGYLALCVLLGVLALGLDSRLAKLVTLIVLAVAGVLFLWWVESTPTRRPQASSRGDVVE